MKFIAPIIIFVLSTIAASPIKSPRVIGGQEARSGQFPFSAAIYTNTDNGRYFCGGAIVSNQWIITAGHCIYQGVSSTIYLGSNSLQKEDENRVTVATSEYVLHPEFSIETLANDIGLLRLHLPVTFNSYIKAIYLPTSDLQENAVLYTTGWGQTSDDDGTLADSLNYVRVSQISAEECKLTYGEQITDKMLCAVGNLNEGTCNGDMGSPLVQFRTATITWHIGIASFVSGNGCESSDPSGYTNTFDYVDWIHSVIEDQ